MTKTPMIQELNDIQLEKVAGGISFKSFAKSAGRVTGAILSTAVIFAAVPFPLWDTASKQVEKLFR